MKKIKLSIFFIFVLCTALLMSCNNQEANKPAVAAENADANIEKNNQAEPNNNENDSYIYPALDCGEEDFTFLNVTTTWDFYTTIVHDEMTGEVLDDAIYSRNRFLEEKFNVNFKEVGVNIFDITGILRKTVMTGDDIYDAAYTPGQLNENNVGALITSNLLHNLKDIPELNLGEYWWNQNICNGAAIGNFNSLYFAGCDINIMNLQGAWCVFFNESIFQNLGLEMPYNLVKTGKWTFDEFYGYMKAGTSLNGAADFKWDLSGPAVYGMTSYEYGMAALIAASGERYIQKNSDGMPYLAIQNERFFNVCDKIADMVKNNGEYQNANNYDTGFHFEMIFRDNKAAMLIGEFKAADVFRTMDTIYGIVPLPKYDEAQQNYHTIVHSSSPLLVIPLTNTELSRAGIILDALAYLSHKDVTPVFFDTTLSLKRLHNEESIEMLKIIRNSVFVELGTAFGWTSDLSTAIFSALDKGKNNAITLIEKNEGKIESSMNKTMEYFGN